MKKSTCLFTNAILFFGFLSFVLLPVNAYSQKKTQEQTLSAFPESVSGIFKNSCIACHSDQSTSKAKIFMNLSEWDKLTPKKQMKTSKKINKKVSKEAMPPAGFLEKHPEATLTSGQKGSISAWALSLQKK